MELRHLRYFAAVAGALNFRRAADRLRVAQPALSSQIRDLEDELGVRLLDRDTGGVRLTDAGAAFLAEVKLILAHAEKAALVAREAAKGRRGRLAIGYFAPIFMGLMPGTLKAFRDQYPDVDVMLMEMTISEQQEALLAGTIHLGFTITHRPLDLPKLRHIAVARSPIRVVLGRGHRLARRRSISFADLAQETILCFSVKNRRPSVHAVLMQEFIAERGLHLNPPREIDGVEAFRAMLESGAGVSLVTELGSLSRGDELVLRPLTEDDPDLFVELHALWRADQESALTTNFIEVMRRLAPKRRAAR